MESRARLFGHPIHQMLIPFPVGLLITAAIFDIIYLFTGNTNWVASSFYIIIAGLVGALIAAVFGLIDFLAIPPGTRAKRIGLMHGLGNVGAVVLFTISWVVRLTSNPFDPGPLPIVLSIIGAGVILFTGWLGGELVDRLGVGVTEGANLNAPSSLSHTTPQPGAAD